MTTPQKNRELFFHFLYSSDFVENELEELCSFLMEYHRVTKKTVYLVKLKVNALQEQLTFIDSTIQKISKEYDWERIPRVEKNLLRIGIFELCFSKQVPPKVAISEAVRLARKFATLESCKFVNAILDAFYQEQCRAVDAASV